MHRRLIPASLALLLLATPVLAQAQTPMAEPEAMQPARCCECRFRVDERPPVSTNDTVEAAGDGAAQAAIDEIDRLASATIAAKHCCPLQ